MNNWDSETEFLVLINYSGNDIEWTNLLKYPSIIYSEWIKANNILKFIIDFYDNLPKNLIVINDKEIAFYHGGSLLEFLNNKFEEKHNTLNYNKFWNWNNQKLPSIVMLKEKMIESGWWEECMRPWFGLLDECNDFTNDKENYSQFVVNRDCIKLRPRLFYENMYNWIIKNGLEEEPVEVNTITKFKEYPKNWNNPKSNYNINIYLDSCWEFIFTSCNFIEDTLKVLYGAKGYYRDVTDIVLNKFYIDELLTIQPHENFNEIFGDHLYGCPKSLLIINGKNRIEIAENRRVSFK